MTSRFKLKRRGPYGPLFIPSDIVRPDEITERWDATLREVVIQLIKACRFEGLESLSAIQLGYPARVFILNVDNDRLRVCINPEITITDFDEEQYEEICGSYYSRTAGRYRHRHLILSANSLEGSPFFLDTADPLFPAGVSRNLSVRIQHEIEHLNGVNVRDDPELPD